MGGTEDAGPDGCACWAPRYALYLRPDGQVAACCATAWSIGSVTGPERRSLAELWRSARLAQQATALAGGSFELGCQGCAPTIGRPRAATLAHHFDRFASDPPPEHPRLLDLALSNRCNLRCQMCNGNLSSAIRAQREHLPPLPTAYDDRFFDELFELLPHVERLQFKGGEPFLAPENRRIWDHLIDHGLRPEVTVTTNGTVWDERVERYLVELAMEPTISVDALDPDLLSEIRAGVDPAELWRTVDRVQAVAERTGRPLTLNFCLMTVNWRELPAFLRECDRRGALPNVIPVDQPDGFDLARRPATERAAIAAELRDAADRLGSRAAGVLHAVAEALDAPATPVEVRVRPSAQAGEVLPLAPLDDQALAALRAELADEHGAAPIEAELVEGLVARVEVPAWAAGMGVEAWVGRAPEELQPELLAAAGADRLLVGQVPALRPGTERILLAADGPRGRTSWWVTRCVEATPGRSRILVHPGTTPEAATSVPEP